jgi:hypothetical protein
MWRIEMNRKAGFGIGFTGGLIAFVMCFFIAHAAYAQPPATVKGHVYDLNTSAAIQGVHVTVSSYSDNTDSEGYYSMTGFFTGTRVVAYTHPDYADTSIERSFSPGTVTLDVDMRRTSPYPGTLSGTVSDADGFLEGVIVTADEEADTTDVNGDYSLELVAGTYEVTFSIAGYSDVVETDVEVAENTNTDLDVLMTKTTGFISGIISNETEPLAGVAITVDGDEYVTEIDGSYSIELAWGIYSINFSMSGYTDVNITTDVKDGGTTSLSMIMPLGQINAFPGDVNGDCRLIGSDVTYLVGYFRGINPHPEFVDCPEE